MGDDYPTTYNPGKPGRGDMAPSASSDSAGETTLTTTPSPPVTVAKFPASATSSRTLSAELETTECLSSYSCCPPTPAAFSASTAMDAGADPGKENFCLYPMAAPFSPLGPPLAVLVARKAPTAHKGGAAMLHRIVDVGYSAAGARDDGGGEKRSVLGNVDTNVLAALPIETINGGSLVSCASEL